MNAKEQLLLQQEVGTTDFRLQLRTGTRIDVGLWWRSRPLWLCITDSDLILLAVGRRRYFERIGLADCHNTIYNPASSELVIAPQNSLRFSRLRMPPSTAIEVINLIKSTPPTPNTTSP